MNKVVTVLRTIIREFTLKERDQLVQQLAYDLVVDGFRQLSQEERRAVLREMLSGLPAEEQEDIIRRWEAKKRAAATRMEGKR